MRWITASELEQWARSNSARDALPKIVSDLILASSPDIAAIRFPNADKGQVRGFDGVLVSGLCQEDARASCCTRDGGGPFEVAL